MPFLRGECEPRAADDAFLDQAEVDAWFERRGSKRPKPPSNAVDNACFVLAASAGGEDALVCTSTRIETRGGSRMTGLATYRRVDRARVFVVKDRRALTLLDAPLLFDMMDKDVLEDGPLFALRITRDAAGRPVVREPSAGACERARAQNAESLALAQDDPVQKRWAAFDHMLIERLCRAAGKGLPSPSGGSSL